MYKLLALGVLCLPVTAVAQARRIELGAGLGVAQYVDVKGPDGYTGTVLGLGGGQFTAALHLTSVIAIEVAVLADYRQVENNSASTVEFDIGVPFSFEHDWGHEGVYVRPDIGLLHASYVTGIHTTQTELGLAIGHKFRIADNASLRLEAGVTHTGSATADGIITAPEMTTIGGLAGVSVFVP